MKSLLNLIQKLRNPSNLIVLHAIEELRKGGWLEDGTLKSLNLMHIHLQNADLHNADFEKSNLNMADLRWANLRGTSFKGACLAKANLYRADLEEADVRDAVMSGVNLQGALNLTSDQLSQARNLLGATMPDGSQYDGRFSLAGDIQTARCRHIDINDPVALEKYYGAVYPTQSFNCNDTGLAGNTDEQLLRKLRSADHQLVIRAVAELRNRCCLSAGVLKWAQLRYVHMQGADLSFANLLNADFSMADLRGANISYAILTGTKFVRTDLRGADFCNTDLYGVILTKANLQGAINLTDQQLLRASRLRHSTLPDGSFYDGRFNLSGDISDAHFLGVNPNEPESIANFYGVSPEDYLVGQTWPAQQLSNPWLVQKDFINVDTENLLLWITEQEYKGE